MNTPINNTTSYNCCCAYRLPCGICKQTMTTCPLWNGLQGTVTPTWTTTTATTTVKGASDDNTIDHNYPL